MRFGLGTKVYHGCCVQRGVVQVAALHRPGVCVCMWFGLLLVIDRARVGVGVYECAFVCPFCDVCVCVFDLESVTTLKLSSLCMRSQQFCVDHICRENPWWPS